MELCVLVLLLVIPGFLSQQDMEGKMFIFPEETNTAHVLLRPTLTNPLEKVSVCLWSYTDLSRPYSLFSLATPGKDNAFLIFLQPPNSCSVYINQEVIGFKTDPESLDWRHTCVTWDSSTRVVQLWVNGKLYPGGVSTKGSSIGMETSTILGQEQDNFGGGFDATQSFVGEISDVHMWDYVLTPEDIQKVFSNNFHGNVINWKSLVHEIKGEVLIKPKVWHMEGKMFVFPKETNTAHVLLRPTKTSPLQKVSICLYSYSELPRTYPLFSYATSEMSNTILIDIKALFSTYYVTVNQEANYFNIESGPLDWRHTCVTWDSNTGLVELWVNGKLYPGGVSIKASSIQTATSIVLGQAQDPSGFNGAQSFVGEISDVHMWDYVLTPEDIQKVIYGHHYGNVINWKSLICEIKGEVLVKPKVLHMKSKVFVFPKETNTAHVLLTPTLTNPLEKVSVCLRSYTDLSRPYSLFSLATPGKDNAFLIFLKPPNSCSVYINQEEIVFRTDPESLDWRNTCVTWDSNTGVVQLWVNGKRYPRKVSKKGSSIAAETSIVLGQEQDKFGGGFEAPQSFVGEISDVHMWDYVLTGGDIQKVIYGDLQGNVINWKSLSLEMKGGVLIQPTA